MQLPEGDRRKKGERLGKQLSAMSLPPLPTPSTPKMLFPEEDDSVCIVIEPKPLYSKITTYDSPAIFPTFTFPSTSAHPVTTATNTLSVSTTMASSTHDITPLPHANSTPVMRSTASQATASHLSTCGGSQKTLLKPPDEMEKDSQEREEKRATNRVNRHSHSMEEEIIALIHDIVKDRHPTSAADLSVENITRAIESIEAKPETSHTIAKFASEGMKREEEEKRLERKRNEDNLIREIEQKRANERELLIALMKANRNDDISRNLEREEELKLETAPKAEVRRLSRRKSDASAYASHEKREGLEPDTEEKRQAERQLRHEQLLKRKEERKRIEEELKKKLEEPKRLEREAKNHKANEIQEQEARPLHEEEQDNNNDASRRLNGFEYMTEPSGEYEHFVINLRDAFGAIVQLVCAYERNRNVEVLKDIGMLD
jgi:hypothetical protein